MSTVVINSSISQYLDSQDAIYANCDAGSGLSASINTDPGLQVISNSTVDNGKYILRQSFIMFDLFAAGLTARSNVSAGIFSLFLNTMSNTTLPSTLEVRSYNFGASVVTSVWRTGAQLAALTPLVTGLLFPVNAASNTRYSWTSVAAMLTAISAALASDGKLRVVVNIDVQASGTATAYPDRRDSILYSGASVGHEPQLSLTYTQPSVIRGTIRLGGRSYSRFGAR